MDFFLGVQLHFTIDQNIDLYSIHSLPIRDIFCGIFLWKSPGKERNDIVNIGLHFFHKDVRLYAASCSEV